MRFDVFGKFQIELARRDGKWIVSRFGQGMGSPLDLAIPPEYDMARALRFLEDLWHESAGPGREIRRIEP
jgi:hypothetical protein